MSTKRTIVTYIIVAQAALTILFFSWTAFAQAAVPVYGGSADQQRLVQLVCYWQYPMLAQIRETYPDFYVIINYGGRAWEGHVDVNIKRTGWAFSHYAAHEFCHEVQLASDNSGGNLGAAWLDKLREYGYTDEQWIWGYDSYWGTKRDPWEALAENMRRALFIDFSVSPTYPNTVLLWLQPSAMVEFLRENGIDVWEGR